MVEAVRLELGLLVAVGLAWAARSEVMSMLAAKRVAAAARWVDLLVVAVARGTAVDGAEAIMVVVETAAGVRVAEVRVVNSAVAKMEPEKMVGVRAVVTPGVAHAAAAKAGARVVVLRVAAMVAVREARVVTREVVQMVASKD